MKYLIINADDFGLHKTVNLGIIHGHTSGFITSATIVPGGKAFEHAVKLASVNKSLGIGVQFKKHQLAIPQHFFGMLAGGNFKDLAYG